MKETPQSKEPQETKRKRKGEGKGWGGGFEPSPLVRRRDGLESPLGGGVGT